MRYGFTDQYANPHVGFGALEPVTDGRLLLRKWAASGIRQNWIGEPSAVMVRRMLKRGSTGFSSRISQFVDVDLRIRLLPSGTR